MELDNPDRLVSCNPYRLAFDLAFDIAQNRPGLSGSLKVIIIKLDKSMFVVFLAATIARRSK